MNGTKSMIFQLNTALRYNKELNSEILQECEFNIKEVHF